MNPSNTHHAARIILVMLLSISHIGLCRAEQQALPGFDRVGVGESIVRDGESATRNKAPPPEVASVRSIAATGKRPDARKSELARRMFWIMLSMR